MDLVQMVIRCQSKYREVLVGDTAGTACVAQKLAGQVLVTLYEQVKIDDVAVQFPPFSATLEGDYCVMHIQARCLGKRWQHYDEQAMEVLIEVNIAPPLIELFGSVTVEVSCISDAP